MGQPLAKRPRVVLTEAPEDKLRQLVGLDVDDTAVGTIAKPQPWKAVVLDLDETTGSWGVGSLAYNIYYQLAGKKQPPVALFVEKYLARGAARPWLLELLQTMQQWKQSGRIGELAIFTAASNERGWVTFLRQCMEDYACTPGLFGRCICREQSPEALTAEGTRTLKDLSRISSDSDQVVLIDDQPRFVTNGYVIGVPELSLIHISEPTRPY
eukprot:TRINITY_DN7098_c0_g1_i1.p1 TRINITY_DN7098_c0_g1~~TRINITY_DN7098_c0_g1_i1.p1  ORF type:complete len:212 (-),score=43.90 TRINITY_DN7098_c0_g1_i1:40-675(-)